MKASLLRSFASLFLLSSFLLFSSCGYRMQQSGVDMGDIQYQSIMIFPFHNNTLQPAAEVFATKAWREEAFNEDAFDIVSKKQEADLLLKGEVTGYSNEVQAVDVIGSATEYRLVLTLRYTLIDNITGRKLFSDTISGSWDYKYGANTIDNDIRLRDALENLNKELAQDGLLLLRERLELLARRNH